MFSERSRASRGAADAASWPHRRPYKAYHEICGLVFATLKGSAPSLTLGVYHEVFRLFNALAA